MLGLRSAGRGLISTNLGDCQALFHAFSPSLPDASSSFLGLAEVATPALLLCLSTFLPCLQVLVCSGASAKAAAMQIAAVMTVVALLTTTAVTLADPAAGPPRALRTPAMPKLLYVMEYDCMFDWEPVKLEQGVTGGVLAWMTQLQDRLTLTLQTPLGKELMVSLKCH